MVRGVSEQVLIDRALEGNEEAFNALYRRFFPCVYGTVASRAAHPDEAEDLVQLTFIRAFRSLKTFRGDAAFSTWIVRIALNVCRSHHQSQSARQARMEAAGVAQAEDQGASGGGDDPESLMDRKERRELVKAGIRALPDPYREAMWLRYVQDRSYEEIVRELGAPMGTVKTWLSRARRQLGAQFRQRGWTGL